MDKDNYDMTGEGETATIEGKIDHVGELGELITVGAFRCSMCGKIIAVEQPGVEEERLMEPAGCLESMGGCGRMGNDTKMQLMIEKCQTVSTRKISIIDAMNYQRKDVWLFGEMARKKLTQGVKARISGGWKRQIRKKGDGEKTQFVDWSIVADNIEYVHKYQVMAMNTLSLLEKRKFVTEAIAELAAAMPEMNLKEGVPQSRIISRLHHNYNMASREVKILLSHMIKSGEIDKAIEGENPAYKLKPPEYNSPPQTE